MFSVKIHKTRLLVKINIYITCLVASFMAQHARPMTGAISFIAPFVSRHSGSYQNKASGAQVKPKLSCLFGAHLWTSGNEAKVAVQVTYSVVLQALPAHISKPKTESNPIKNQLN